MIQGKAIEKRTKLNYRQKWSLMLQSRPTLKAQGVQLVGGIMSLHSCKRSCGTDLGSCDTRTVVKKTIFGDSFQGTIISNVD